MALRPVIGKVNADTRMLKTLGVPIHEVDQIPTHRWVNENDQSGVAITALVVMNDAT
jgi:hypothetical protein